RASLPESGRLARPDGLLAFGGIAAGPCARGHARRPGDFRPHLPAGAAQHGRTASLRAGQAAIPSGLYFGRRSGLAREEPPCVRLERRLARSGSARAPGTRDPPARLRSYPGSGSGCSAGDRAGQWAAPAVAALAAPTRFSGSIVMGVVRWLLCVGLVVGAT